MSERCEFSFTPVDIPSDATRHMAQCPLCGATRQLQRRSYGWCFAGHNPLVAPAQVWPCWKRIGETWTWKPVEYAVQISYHEDGVHIDAERK